MLTSLKLRSMQRSQKEGESMVSRVLPTEFQQWLLSCAVLWFMTGFFLDGWAHNHIPALETFFTVWHAVFYSGYFFIVASLVGITLSQRGKQGGSFLAAIPFGYDTAMIGVVVFAVGGLGDLVWHEFFGVEKTIEALLSPTHLILAVGGCLMITANLRVWFLTLPPLGVPKFVDQVPMLFSLASMLSTLAFFTQFSHVITVRAGGEPPVLQMIEVSQSAAITGYLFDTVLMLGCFLLIARRAKLAIGACTFVLTLPMLAMALMRDGLLIVPSAFIMGLVGDAFTRNIFPFELHARRVRLLCCSVASTFFLCYFVTIACTSGIWWSVHLWTGSIVMSGLTGLLLSYLVLPPKENSGAN